MKVNGKKEKHMDLENTSIKINQCILEIGLKIKPVVLEHSNIVMVIFLKDFGKIIVFKEKENILFLITHIMMENGIMIYLMDKDHKLITVDGHIKVNCKLYSKTRKFYR